MEWSIATVQIDWSNTTVQVAALGILGAVFAASLAGIFATVSALVAGHVSAKASRDIAAMSVTADSAARAELRQAQLDEIQRATLLELQEQLNEWWTARLQVHHADRNRMSDTPKVEWIESRRLDDKAFQMGNRVNVLTERVRDDNLRQALRDLISHAANLEGECSGGVAGPVA